MYHCCCHAPTHPPVCLLLPPMLAGLLHARCQPAGSVCSLSAAQSCSGSTTRPCRLQSATTMRSFGKRHLATSILVSLVQLVSKNRLPLHTTMIDAYADNTKANSSMQQAHAACTVQATNFARRLDICSACQLKALQQLLLPSTTGRVHGQLPACFTVHILCPLQTQHNITKSTISCSAITPADLEFCPVSNPGLDGAALVVPGSYCKHCALLKP